MARTTKPFTVGGDERSFESVLIAIVVAQKKAERADEPISFGVFESDNKVARVERDSTGVVLTYVLNGGES